MTTTKTTTTKPRHFKYRVMSWSIAGYSLGLLGTNEPYLQEVARRHFNNVNKMNDYVFLQRLLGRTVEVMDMEEFNKTHDDERDAIITYYSLMFNNRISDARRFFQGESV